ncbi:hypothetical protein MMC10_010050 [Thelotrema lepadinum]|nr:hypothetical protein [Thelotrema lepadinum]
MQETVIPRTPSPLVAATKPAYTSPPPRPSSHLTPPPTTEIPRHSPNFLDTENGGSRVEIVSDISNGIRSGRLPTVEEARSLSGEECRDLVLELLPAIGETRMALAHTQLQLNLLSIESTEAAQRAEVEHDMTRREVEVLRAGSPVIRSRTPLLNDPRSPIAQVQRQLELTVEAGREVEVENMQLHHRLRQAKKVIRHLNGKNSQLLEDNDLLRERIKQNRNHIDAIRAADPQFLGLSPSSAHLTPSRTRTSKPHQPHRPQTPSQNPLETLLMADQILSGDPSSVPATPSPYRTVKPSSGHVRGTQSLSSLPSTPTRTRPMTASELQHTPVNRIISTSHLSYSAPTKQRTTERARGDRDSTISASEDEALTDEDVPASQASQAASNMLRRLPGVSPENSQKLNSQKGGRMIQSKTARKIAKPKTGGATNKRKYDSDSDAAENVGARKRTKARVGGNGNFGLGIGVGSSPRRR